MQVEGPLDTECNPQHSRSPFGLDNDGYARAQENLLRCDPERKLSGFQFPSKYAMIRFVKAFFEYMNTQLPIVHGPTFDAATASCTYLPQT